MKHKRLIFYILSFLAFLTFTIISSKFFVNYQKSLAVNQINRAIEKRLSDYQSIFSILKSKMTGLDDINVLSSYSQQQIYLSRTHKVTLGELECKFINNLTGQEISGWDASQPILQEKLFQHTGFAVISPAYHSVEAGGSLVTNVGFSFDLDSHKCLLKTTIFLPDLFSYNTHPLLFISREDKKKSSLFSATYYHPDLGIHIGIDLDFTYLLFYVITCTFLYILSLFFARLTQIRRESAQVHKINALVNQENLSLTKRIHHLENEKKFLDFSNLSSIYSAKKYSNPPTLICLREVIEYLLHLYQEKTEEKSINILLKEEHVHPIMLFTRKEPLATLLGLYLQLLIKENPPHSKISCSISIDDTVNSTMMVKIAFHDDRTFGDALDSHFFNSEVTLLSSIKISIQHLMKSINAVVKSSTSPQNGNKTIIIIPNLDKNPTKIDSESNVIHFNR